MSLACTFALTGCAAIVEYTDQLRSDEYRTGFVSRPSEFAGMVGFVAGVPVDIVAFPITGTVYAVSQDEDGPGVDPLSTLLFPSFFLQRASILAIGTPLDMLEYVFYRAWLEPTETDQFERDRKEGRPGDGLKDVGTRGMD